MMMSLTVRTFQCCTGSVALAAALASPAGSATEGSGVRSACQIEPLARVEHVSVADGRVQRLVEPVSFKTLY